MRRLSFLFLFLSLVSACFAQQLTYAPDILTHSHGGYPLLEHFGANKGDSIDLDAISDSWKDSSFFFGNPQLTGNDTLFVQTIAKEIDCPKQMGWFKPGARCWHEHWTAISPTTGDQYVWAQYLLFGTDAHYTIRIIQSENQ